MVGKTVAFASILLVGLVHAQDASSGFPEFLEPHAWQIAPEVYYFRYEEPGLMEEEGTFYGLTASFTSRRERGSREDAFAWSTFKIEARADWGTVDYDGALWDGTPYEIEDIDDFVLGFGLLWGQEWDPTPFISGFHVGLAYRYLNDDPSFDPAGYEREANYLYFPIRLEATAGSRHAWQVAFLGELDILLIGLQISHLGDVMGEPDPEVEEDGNIYNVQLPFSGFGAQGSIVLRHRSEALDIAVGPFIRTWWIAESEPDQGFVEPENNTIEYGLQLIFRF